MREAPPGRVVVITGGAGGIGLALARRFGRTGDRIALLDVEATRLATAADELAADGIDAVTAPCDVTDETSCRAALAIVIERLGQVDVLVNNAGITHLSRFCDTEPQVIRRVMAVNFFGAVHCTKAALESLIARRGQIVVLSSVAGIAPLATRSGYAASKHALHGFFDSLRAELCETGVGVTIVCPSFVRTELGDRALGPGGDRQPMPRTTTGRLLEPAQVADAIYRAVERRRRLVLLSPTAKLSYLLARAWPGLYEHLMTRRIVAPP